MNKKILGGIGVFLFLIGLVFAISYPEPFNSNVDANQYNLTSADWITANVFNGSFGYFNNLTILGDMSGNLN